MLPTVVIILFLPPPINGPPRHVCEWSKINNLALNSYHKVEFTTKMKLNQFFGGISTTEKTLPTCNFGTLVAPPISSTAYISSTFRPECFSSSLTGVRDLSHRSSQSSSNFSRVMVLLKKKKEEDNPK